MSLLQYGVLYAIALTTFLAIDLTWLGFVARGVYASLMRDVIAPEINWPAALGFYAFFVVGLIYFGVYAAGRFFLSYLRLDPAVFLGLRQAQLASALMVVIAIIATPILLRRAPKAAEPAPATPDRV